MKGGFDVFQNPEGMTPRRGGIPAALPRHEAQHRWMNTTPWNTREAVSGAGTTEFVLSVSS